MLDRMKTFLALLLIAAAACAADSARAQTLEPCEIEFLSEYYRGVDSIIDHATGRPAQLSLTVLPSFFAESGVRLVGNDVYSVELKSSYWEKTQSMDSSGHGHMDFSSPQAASDVFHAPLSPEIVARIKQLYIRAISAATKSDRRGFDGVSYRFSDPSVGCGETWSPDQDSPDGRLVELVQLLAEHAKLSKPRTMQRSEESIVRLLNSMGGSH